MLKFREAELHITFTVPKSIGSGVTVRHEGPTEVRSGIDACGRADEVELKTSWPVRVCSMVGVWPVGAERTTTWKDSCGCSSFSTMLPPTIEYARSLPAPSSMPER